MDQLFQENLARNDDQQQWGEHETTDSGVVKAHQHSIFSAMGINTSIITQKMGVRSCLFN